ncbi:hypothetical protein BJX76DRAFT_303384 [Aspergillus varians]
MECLNNDTLLLIGDHLGSHQDRYNCVFINRRSHELFSRALYRSATLKNRSQVRAFLKAIMLRPGLTRVVRSLDFGGWHFEQDQLPLTEDDRALFSLLARINSHSAAEHSQWEKDLCEGVDEAWIALLLSTVPNVRQLNLIYPSNCLEYRGYLDTLFARAAATQQNPGDRCTTAFHRLREVSLRQVTGPDDDKGTFFPWQIMPFLQMPSLQAFSVDSLIEYRPDPADEENKEEDRQTPEKKPQGRLLLSEITLTSSNGAKGMEDLLASCPSLKSFKYQHSDAHLLAEGFQPSAFNQTLSRNKSTLETIWLDNLGEHLPFTISGLNETHDEWFGSFADFTVLKDLRIRLPNLLDIQYQMEPSSPLTEVLPRSIESLYIEGCKEHSLDMLIRQVRSVLDTRKTHFKALRHLHIEGFFHDDDEDANTSGDGASGDGARVIKPRVYEAVQPLIDACAQAEVQLFLRDRMCLQTMHE